MALRRRNANFDLRRRVLCGPAQGKQSGRDPRERFAQAKRKFWAPETRFVWPCAGKIVRPSVSRKRNANFELPRCIFCGPANERKSPRRYSETQKKIPSHGFAQAKRKFWPPESRFLWPCAVKNEGDRNLHLDLRGFTLTVRTPQCDTLFGEWCNPLFIQSKQLQNKVTQPSVLPSLTDLKTICKYWRKSPK